MRISMPLAAGLALVAATASGQDTPRGRAKGAMAVSPATYVTYASVGRHRAWLKPKVDLSDRFPAVGDQEWQSSCVAWATGYAARSFMEARDLGRPPSTRQELVSPTYIFYRVRDRKDICVGTGSNVASALELLTKEGAVSMAEMPYGTMTCKIPPNEAQIASAAKWRIGGWRAIQRATPDDWRTPIVLDDVKSQLQAGLPVIFTMPTPDTFDHWAGNGVYSTDETKGGMHAMTLVGYDEDKQAFRLINSWGVNWGDKGYAWIAYDTFARMAQEAYVMQAPSAAPSPAAPPAPKLSVDEQLAQVVGGLECGRARLKSGPGGRVIEGFTGAKGDAARLKALAADPTLRWNVAYRPWPQCEAELTLEPALAQPTTKITVHRDTGAVLAGDPAVLKVDELFSVQVTTAAARPYLHVIYLQADGSAVELYRGLAPPGPGGGRAVTLGAAGTREARFQVAGPFGDEVIIALASDGPLFGSELGDYRTERQFLTLLRNRLAAATRDGRPVSAALQRMTTKAG